MLEKSPKCRTALSKLLLIQWFKLSDSELHTKVQELVEERAKVERRKEYLQMKAALRGNKFINDEGKVVVMNCKINEDIRNDLL